MPAHATATGNVVGLFVQEAPGAPPKPLNEATALCQRGLLGDTHSKGPPGRKGQVLLTEASDLHDLGLKPGDLREQITVHLPGLMAMRPGSLLAVGDAVLQISGACAPCTTIGSVLGRSDPETFRDALAGRRGLLARVIEVSGAGRIAIGSKVRELVPGDEDPPSARFSAESL